MAQSQLLCIEGNTHVVNSYGFSAYQLTDPMTNRPISTVSLSKINISLKLAPIELKFFWLWAKEDKSKKDGEICCTGIDYSDYKVVFKEGICTNLQIHDSTGGIDWLQVQLEIAARIIEVDGVEVSLNW